MMHSTFRQRLRSLCFLIPATIAASGTAAAQPEPQLQLAGASPHVRGASAAAPDAPAAVTGPCAYALDDGEADQSWGAGGGGDFFWCNQFDVSGECTLIDTISVQFGQIPDGVTARLFVYQDPDHDGLPDDAILLTGPIEVTVANADLPVFNDHAIPPTAVSGTFFVGVAVTHGAAEFPAPADESAPSAEQSWYVVDGDADDPLSGGAAKLFEDAFSQPADWMLRASGTSVDDCPADTNGDAHVNVDDLVNVILCWGSDGIDCPESGQSTDVNQEGSSAGVVDVDDLVALILAWDEVCFDICSDAPAVEAGSGNDAFGCDPVQTLLEPGPDLGGPAIACAPDTVTQAWVVHEAQCIGNLLIDTNGSAVDTVLEVWDGCPESGGTLAGCDDDSGADGADSALTVPATPGSMFWIRVASSGSPGSAVLNICCETALPENDFCAEATIAVPPGGETIVVTGQTVTATNDPEATPCPAAIPNQAPGVWYTIPGTNREFTASLCTGTEYDAVLQVFCGPCDALQCVSGDDDGCGTVGGPSTVTWCTSNTELYFIYVQGFAGATGEFTLTITQGLPTCIADPCYTIEPPPNDYCADAIPIGAGLHPFSTETASTDGPTHPQQCGTSGDTGHTTQDIWFSYTAECWGLLRVTTCELLGGSADYDSDIVIYDPALVAGAVCDDLEGALLGCNDDDLTCTTPGHPTQSTVEVEVAAGKQYLIRVGGWSHGSSGSGELLVECIPSCPPTCLPGAQLEGEPIYCSGGVDEYNSGCVGNGSMTPIVGPLPAVICGTGSHDLWQTDVDWYSFTPDLSGTYVWTVTAEFTTMLGVSKLTSPPGPGCMVDGIGSASGLEICEPASVEFQAEAGEVYALTVRPFGLAPCPDEDPRGSNEYGATLTGP